MTATIEEITKLPAPFSADTIPSRDDLAALSSVLMDVSEFYLEPLLNAILARFDGDDIDGRGVTDDEFGRLFRWCLHIRDEANDIREDISKIAVTAVEAGVGVESPFDKNGHPFPDYPQLRERIGFGAAS